MIHPGIDQLVGAILPWSAGVCPGSQVSVKAGLRETLKRGAFSAVRLALRSVHMQVSEVTMD
jgi:hypothetical protein